MVNESGAWKWVIVAYDLPNEPSKLRVRAWRNFKKLGALYPSVSLCILPNTSQVRKEIELAKAHIRRNGTILALRADALERADSEELFKMFEEDRRKQYDEIYEEFQEFLDEVKENIENKKITYEETDELEHAFEGLKRWYNNIRKKGYGRHEDAAKVENIMKECRRALDSFSEKAQPEEINN